MKLFDGFYQLGFVARILDKAVCALGTRYGITRFRRKQLNETMCSAHVYAGDIMIEIVEVSKSGPSFYLGYLPAADDTIRLHHHGFRVPDEARWAAIVATIDERGLERRCAAQ
ncbi:MAG: hypothetical protein EPO08_00535 [Rhodospirillaceae bacterium]|nr:MAG: hypothetical protein EPO08_00535 [Rhodospirillaceae bacterium]